MRDITQSQDGRQKGYIRKRFLLSSMLLALIFSAQATHASNVATLVLNDPNFPPFTNKGGDGFFDIIAGETFRRAGLRLKLVKLPPERGLINANAGIEDGDLNRIAGLEKAYPNLVRVPEKLMDMHFVVFARTTKPAEASWAMLEPLAVGHIKGWKIFEQNLRPATHIITVDSPEQLFALLGKNRINAALYERWEGYAMAKQMRMTDIRVIEPPLAVREMYIYLNQRHAGKIAAIAAALRAIKADGTYTRVCREKLAPLAESSSQCAVK